MTARPTAFRRRAKSYTIVLFGNHDRIVSRRTSRGKYYNNNVLRKKSYNRNIGTRARRHVTHVTRERPRSLSVITRYRVRPTGC